MLKKYEHLLEVAVERKNTEGVVIESKNFVFRYESQLDKDASIGSENKDNPFPREMNLIKQKTMNDSWKFLYWKSTSIDTLTRKGFGLKDIIEAGMLNGKSLSSEKYDKSSVNSIVKHLVDKIEQEKRKKY